MSVVFIIRHAEKPVGDEFQGVTAEGMPNAESLTVRGWQRAGGLACFFGSGNGLPTPDRFYAAASTKVRTTEGKLGSRSERPDDTVSAIAAKLGKEVINRFTKGQEPALVTEVTAFEGTTLVCWQHEAIPAIAALILRTRNGIPDPWPSDRFDVVWRFVRSGQVWTFDQVCQRLLAGDRSEAIA